MSPIRVVQNRRCGFTPAHRLQQVQNEALQMYADRVVSGRTSFKPAPRARKFISAPRLQERSRFCQLPSELRTMIFRSLLLNGETLDWDSRCSRPNFSFEPNALAVCQTWYAEAADILYQENTFTIFFKPDQGYPVGFLRSLYPANCGNGGFGLTSQFPLGIEKFASKFRLRLWLYPFHRKDTSIARAYKLLPVFCRAVTNLLAGSDILLQPWSRDGNYSMEAFEAISYWLPALKLLRCKTFEVLSPTADGPIFYMGSVWDKEDLLVIDEVLEQIRHLTPEITSNTKPTDPYIQLFAANRALTRLRMSLFEASDGYWVDKQITMLEIMVRDQNHEGFKKLWESLQDLIHVYEQVAEAGQVRLHKFCSLKVRRG